MKILVTADIHFNHPRSRVLAEELIERINAMTFDVLILVGDTCNTQDRLLEQCLGRFTFAGPKLFVAGNHELWTRDGDSHHLFVHDLPQRVSAAGWHWLEDCPLTIDGIGFAGTIGWYDYSFAPMHLQVPHRFYQAKVSPGAADRLSEFEHLLHDRSDILDHHLEIVARWNDGRYVRLNRPDEQFLHERLAGLQQSLEKLRPARGIIAVSHHLPFRQMLPPQRVPSWDFAWAYLGSGAIGDLLLQYPNVTHVLTGHSHMAFEELIGHIQVINIGSGYRQKQLRLLEIP